MDSITRQNITMLTACAKARKTLALVGAPATAKTSVIRQVADHLGYELITLIGSRMDPTDVSGLPHSEEIEIDGMKFPATVYLANWWQVRTLQLKKVILFFNEFSNTPPATRASLLSFLQDREFPNGQKLPDETIIVVAMNPSEEAADGFDLDLPTINRMGWLSWRVSNDSWFEGMKSGNFETPFDIDLVPDSQRNENELFWRKRIVRFLGENPGFIHLQPKEDAQMNLSMFNLTENNPSDTTVFRNAWASRRSWNNIAEILGFIPKADVPIQDALLSAFVGFSAATNFREWIRKNDATINPADVMANPKKFKWNDYEVAEIHTILRAIPDVIDEKNYIRVPDLITSFTEQKCDNLIAPFFNEIIRATNQASRRGRLIDPNEFQKQIAACARALTKKDDR